MSKQKSWMERYLEAMERTGDATLRWYFQKEMAKAALLSDDEIDRIADRVLSKLSITVDASEIIKEIDELRKAIERLGQ